MTPYMVIVDSRLNLHCLADAAALTKAGFESSDTFLRRDDFHDCGQNHGSEV
jgi:hypothetical protein